MHLPSVCHTVGIVGKRLREPYKVSEFKLNILALWIRVRRLRKARAPYQEVGDQVSYAASSCLSRWGDKASPEITVTQGRKTVLKDSIRYRNTGTRGRHDYLSG